MLQYPNISKEIITLGPFAIRWYSLMYVFGFMFTFFTLRYLSRKKQITMSEKDIDQLLMTAMFSMLIGARLFYVVFYNPWVYIANPLEILFLWRGGLSFHGGMVGIIAAIFITARKQGFNFLHLADMVAIPAPLGLGFGRIGNFINGELYGRVTDGPMGMIFPTDPDRLPRHPSQLYQSMFEGFCLFGLLWFMKRFRFKDGTLGCLFLGGYGVARFFVEFYRQPDSQLGFISFGLSMGQLMCIAMILGALLLYKFSPKVYSRGAYMSEKTPETN